MLTNKGKYGLKALVHLARHEPQDFVLVSEIATARGIPRKFLEAIMTELRNAGYVVSRKGKAGGYRLSRSASQIRIGSVIRTLEGTLAPIGCASKNRYEPCEDCDEAICEVRRLMIDVRQAICDVLDTRNLAELSAQAALLALVDEPCPEPEPATL